MTSGRVLQQYTKPGKASVPVRTSLLQRAATGPSAAQTAPPIVNDVLRAPGRPLDAATRAFMEPRFGHDFSQVRVHTDAQAAESARAVNALAYTVGSHVVFGGGRYAPGSAMGRKLLAHELAHVAQQSNAPSHGKPRVNPPGDVFEREADATAQRVMTGAGTRGALMPSALAIQRQTPAADAAQKPEEKKDAGEVVAEGVKTVAEQAKDNNPQVKKVIIEPIKERLKGDWNRLGTGEKVTAISFGAATLGMTGGALLSDPGGRKQLEGVNLAAPFTLIPYMPLTTFKYTLPSGDGPAKRLFQFETGFNADELLKLRTEARGLPKASLSVNLRWGYDPASERLTVLGGDATLGLVPGLSLSGGAYKDVLRGPQTFVGPGGETTQVKKSFPESAKPQAVPDMRVMLTVDLLKFKPGDLVKQIQRFF